MSNISQTTQNTLSKAYSNNVQPDSTSHYYVITPYHKKYHRIHNVLEEYSKSSLLLPSATSNSKTHPLITTEISSTNFQYIYGSKTLTLTRENSGSLIRFFKAYLDMLAKKIAINKKPSPLLDLMNTTRYEDAITLDNDLWCYHGNRDTNYEQYQSPSLIELIGIICNRDQNTACAIVAGLTNTSFENLYKFTKDTHSADYNANEHYSFSFIPKRIADYTLSDIKKITGYAGQEIGYICTYNNDKCFINVMASIANNMLAFGIELSTAYFINHAEIDKKQEKTILFFQNYNQARAFEKYLEQCTTPPTNIIVTSHISNDINTLQWSLLQGREGDIIFIPETTQRGFNEIKNYQELFDKYDIHSRIYPYPLLFRSLSNLTALQEGIENEQLSLLENTLLEKAELVDDCQIPSNMVKILIEESLPCKEFDNWITQFTTETEIKDSAENPKNSLLELLAFYPQKGNESILTDYSQIPITSFFCNENITILHARKDSGKSIAALEIGKCIAFNTGGFNFIKGAKGFKVLYIDGETSEDAFNQRLTQLGLPHKNFTLFSLKSLSKSDEEPWNSFNLAEKGHREKVKQLIRKEHIKFLILDNITCLVGGNNIASIKLAQEVTNWATELSSFASILIIHHTNEKEDKISGSDIWRRRCTNEIQLLGKKDLKTLPQLPEEIRQAAQSCEGVFFGMRFNNSKSCSILKDKIVWASLPLGASKWNLHAITDENGKILKDLSVECHEEEISTENITAIPPDQMEQNTKLSNYDKIYQAVENKEFSRSDIDELFHCGKDKSHKILKELGELVEEIGNGNQKRYRLLK